VGHGGRALLAFTEELLCFQDFRSLQVANLYGKFLDGRSDYRQGGKELGMPVSLNDLG